MSDVINSDAVYDAVAAAFVDIPEEGDLPVPELDSEVSRETDIEVSPNETVEEKRVRDEKGRFAKSEQQKAVAAKSEDSAPAQKAIDQSDEVASKEASETPILAPNSWSTEEKAKFAALPRDVKEVITRREKERDNFIFQKSEELSRAQRRYAEIDEFLGPREHQLALNGMTPAAYLRQVVAGADMLEADPVGQIRQFINHYGIQPQQLFGGQTQQVDPYQQRLDILEYRERLREQQFEEAQKQQRAQYLEEINRGVKQYQNEVDANGALIRPYFEYVSAHINQLVPLIQAESPNLSMREVLDRAYDQAVYANPQVRAEILKKERAVQEAKGIEDAKRRVAEARIRGSSISGAPGGSSIQSPSGLRSIVESAFNEHVR